MTSEKELTAIAAAVMARQHPPRTTGPIQPPQPLPPPSPPKPPPTPRLLVEPSQWELEKDAADRERRLIIGHLKKLEGQISEAVSLRNWDKFSELRGSRDFLRSQLRLW